MTAVEPAAAFRFPEDWTDWPDEAKAKLYAALAQRRGQVEYDHRTRAAIDRVHAWRQAARPEQLPPEQPWMLAYLRGGRRSGKTWAGDRWFAELILDWPGGEWGIVAPTFGDAVSVDVEGPSGLLAAFGTTPAQVDAGRSPIVRRWNRSKGELWLRPEVGGGLVMCDGANDGALRIQGHGLRGVHAVEVGLWEGRWRTAWMESIQYAVAEPPARKIATGTPKRNMPARELVRLLLHGDQTNAKADVQRRLRTIDNLDNLDPTFAEDVRRRVQLGGPDAEQELEGELLEAGGVMFSRASVEIVDDWPREARLCRRWDFAATAVKPGTTGAKRGADPDWTVGLLLGVHEGVWFVIDVVRIRANPGDVRGLVIATRDRDRADHAGLLVRMEQEPGSSGKTVVDSFARGVFVGDSFAGVPSTGSKIVRAEPVAAAAAAGNLKVVRGPWNEAFLDELEMFPDVTHDDQVDALSGAFTDLSHPARRSTRMRFHAA